MIAKLPVILSINESYEIMSLTTLIARTCSPGKSTDINLCNSRVFRRKKDYVGHERDRGSGCKPIISSKSWGECCYYGEDDALAIVLDLLVDCNYRGLGHRKIMLSDQFKSMGVYIAPHKSYNFNAVLDFTGE